MYCFIWNIGRLPKFLNCSLLEIDLINILLSENTTYSGGREGGWNFSYAVQLQFHEN